MQYWILIGELSLCLQPVFLTLLPVVISWHSCWEERATPALCWLGLSCWHVFGSTCWVLQTRLWEQGGAWACFFLCLPFGKLLVPSHSLEGTQRCFWCTPHVSIMGKMEMVPHLPALMQLGSVKEMLKGFLWQGAAPGAHLRVACGSLWWSALLSEALRSRLAPDCPWSLWVGRVCLLPVQGGILSWLPLPRSWIWGWSVISRLKLRLPCCVLAFLLERSRGSPSCCSADWDAGLGGCSKQQVLHGWVSHCGKLVGRDFCGSRIRLTSVYVL